MPHREARPIPSLETVPGRYAICRIDRTAGWPDWLPDGFVSVTRTDNEWSVVCEQSAVPSNVVREAEWRMLRVAGAMPLNMVGVLAGLSQSLADARISLFAMSTFDTDYLLIKDTAWANALEALRASGYDLVTVAGDSESPQRRDT